MQASSSTMEQDGQANLPMYRAREHFIRELINNERVKKQEPGYHPELVSKGVATLLSTGCIRQGLREIDEPLKDYNQSGNTIILMGETGCGKSTQIPQIVDSYYRTRFNGKFSMVITEPRRLAAVTLADRVESQMRANRSGAFASDEVGYTVRFNSTATERTRIHFVTEGILVQELLSDPYLTKYNVVVVDEAHERSISTDLLLGQLKKIVHYRSIIADMEDKDILRLKLIIMTATGEASMFQKTFPGSKLVYVEGRAFDVDIEYLTMTTPDDDYMSLTMSTLMRLHECLPDDDHILVFMTGQEEIDWMVRELRSADLPISIMALPLYAALPNDAQQEAFEMPPAGTRKIVVATNIAETSLTIPGIQTVVDCGFVKSKYYIAEHCLETYQIRRTSKSQAAQRAGRAGREQPGKVYRMYTEEDHDTLPMHEEPEITRSSLAHTLLLLPHFMKIDSVFPMLDTTDSAVMSEGLSELTALGLVDLKDNACLMNMLTIEGETLSRFPLEPKLSKIVLDSARLGVMHQVCAIVGILESENLFASGEYNEPTTALERFRAPEGDLITYLNIFKEYCTMKFKFRWCVDNNINPRAMQHAIKVRKQLLELLHGLYTQSGATYKPKPEAMVNDAIVKCFALNIRWNRASLDRSGRFYKKEDIPKMPLPTGTVKPPKRELRAKIHPSSVLLSRPPRIFFMNVTLSEKNDMFLHHCTVFDKSMESMEC